MIRPNRAFRSIVPVLLSGALAWLLFACSETQAPAPPSSISIVPGNSQYSLRGTTLPEPLVVRVLTDAGDVPGEVYVTFTVLQGGGTLSAPVAPTDARGIASSAYTLGPNIGTAIILASIQSNPSQSVLFEATSANFYCPEQEDTFRVSYGTPHRLFLVTRKSSLYPSLNSAGVVEIDLELPGISTSGFTAIPGGGGGLFDNFIFDCAFSPRGDFYVARRSYTSEILIIDTAGDISFFGHLSEDVPFTEPQSEIAMNPSGLLVGCDVNGPFAVGCGDTLYRFDEATYDGDINNDAVAVDPRRQAEDPLGEDIYFIDRSSSTLMRLAMDSLSVETRGLESVASLSQAEADSATGMVCTGEGVVYILVDALTVKEVLEVTPGGDVSIVYDFFDRGAGDAAGIQRDLAYDEVRGFRYLYTLDTLNDNILRLDVDRRLLAPMFNDSLVQSTLSNRGQNGALIGGERVGLVVIP
jgi:hypothetical protein